ncbi:MAG: aminotransferase class V-fold PLP-dependent enzyme [Ruminococcus sp.]|jgi:cysteine desulfurase family protein|nr:aminotransferase class V-fold PLP-dependent enzyme [Ruminococcus sp.]
MVNFDNAATTFPKPKVVVDSVAEALNYYGGNPGRSGHKLSLQTAEKIYETREKAASFFNAYPENVVFTLNCTHALNLAVKGVADDRGEIIISSLEHNSVARPAVYKAKSEHNIAIAHVSDNDDETIKNIRKKITSKTRVIVFTLGSNVTGRITPYRRIGELCAKNNICFIADAAQAAGVIPIDIKKDNINILCCPGHKGLYGPPGTGMLITDGKYPIKPILQGGTGSESLSLHQPEYMPDALESGTVNTSGIIGLGAGIDFVTSLGLDNIYRHEFGLCERFLRKISQIADVIVYMNINYGKYLPIVLFNINGMKSSETAGVLSEKGFALRGGLHCSGLAHKSIGTAPNGAVRFSPSIFNSEKEVDDLTAAINDIINGR